MSEKRVSLDCYHNVKSHGKHLIFNSVREGHGIYSLNLYSSNYSGLRETRIISTGAHGIAESQT